jgi:hypothetical protein
MKTQILRLDPHDDLLSTRDKMNWGRAGRILLVWPEEGRLLRRRVDLILLQRHSLSLGAQLALVTGDPLIRFHARYLAIPTFRDLHQAQSAHWRVERKLRLRQGSKPTRRVPRKMESLETLRQAAHPDGANWLELPAARVASFTLGVLAVLVLAAILLPGAQINLAPRIQTQELDFTVRASLAQVVINFSGVVPARTVIVVVEGRDSLEASGTSRVAGEAASGEVVITNLTDQPVRIPRGLVVRNLDATPIRFATLQPAEIDAGPGITATLGVRALTPGRGGNLPAASLTAIEGDLGLSLAATNPAPTQGGTDRSLPVPTAADRRQLYTRLENALQGSALEELESGLTPGDLLFTGTLSITQVVEQDYLPAGDEPSPRLELSLRVEYQAYTAARADLDSLAGVLLDTNLPEGYTPLPDTLSIQVIQSPVLEADGLPGWRMSARRSLKAVVPPDQVTNLLLGATPAEAAARLQAAYPLDAPPAIRLLPDWWPRLPLLPFRIQITGI